MIRMDKFQELEAQVAAMREALMPFVTKIVYLDDDWATEGRISVTNDEIRTAKKALSSSAGRDLLERVKKLEAQRSVAKEALEKLRALLPEFSCLDLEKQIWGIINDALAALEGGDQDA